MVEKSMARKSRSVLRDTFSLSFLDVLCCSLGAAVVLFLAFANSRPEQGAAGGLLNRDMIEVDFAVDDPQAFIRLIVKSPDEKIRSIDVGGLDADGFVTEADTAWRKVRVIGGNEPVALASTTSPRRRLTRLLVFDPKPGKWRFDVQYYDRTDITSLVSSLATLQVERRVRVTHKSRARERNPDLIFGEQTNFAVIVLEQGTESP